MISRAKRVVIAIASLGGGHHSIAQALAEAINDLDHDANVSVLNVFSSDCSAFPLTAIPSLYPVFTARFPFLWRGLFYGTYGRIRYGAAERLVQPFIRPRLKQQLAALAPDIVVAAFPALGYSLHRAILELGWRIPLGVVVSDLVTIHPAWLYHQANWITVPTSNAFSACLSTGIEVSRVHCVGLPIRRAFFEPVSDRLALRQSLGLDAEIPVVLVVANAGKMHYLEAVISELLKISTPQQIVLVTGGFATIANRFKRKFEHSPHRTMGYVTNMAQWMRAADVLVAKAGPSTIMEAVQCELPMVLMWSIPGQEDANLDYVVRNGIGVVGRDPRTVRESVQMFLADTAQANRVRNAMQALQQPDSAQQVSNLILGGRKASVADHSIAML